MNAGTVHREPLDSISIMPWTATAIAMERHWWMIVVSVPVGIPDILKIQIWIAPGSVSVVQASTIAESVTTTMGTIVCRIVMKIGAALLS